MSVSSFDVDEAWVRLSSFEAPLRESVSKQLLHFLLKLRDVLLGEVFNIGLTHVDLPVVVELP